MLIEQINPFVRQAIITRMNASFASRTVHNMLINPDNRLFHILSGSGEMLIDKTTYLLSAGTTVVIPSGTEYMWQIEDIKYCAVNFDYTHKFSNIKKSFGTCLSKEFDKNDIPENICFDDALQLNAPIVLPNSSALETPLRTLITEFHMGGDWCDTLVTSLTKSLILQIARMTSSADLQKADKSTQLIKDIIDYITSNYHKDINNGKIAQRFSFNPSYLNRIFRQHTGVSMHKFIINYRISTARELISNHNMSLDEIAAATGFSDLPHFSKTFKKHTGKSPNSYR